MDYFPWNVAPAPRNILYLTARILTRSRTIKINVFVVKMIDIQRSPRTKMGWKSWRVDSCCIYQVGDYSQHSVVTWASSFPELLGFFLCAGNE